MVVTNAKQGFATTSEPILGKATPLTAT